MDLRYLYKKICIAIQIYKTQTQSMLYNVWNWLKISKERLLFCNKIYMCLYTLYRGYDKECSHVTYYKTYIHMLWYWQIISCTYLYNHFCLKKLIYIVMELLELIQCYTILYYSIWHVLHITHGLHMLNTSVQKTV